MSAPTRPSTEQPIEQLPSGNPSIKLGRGGLNEALLPLARALARQAAEDAWIAAKSTNLHMKT